MLDHAATVQLGYVVSRCFVDPPLYQFCGPSAHMARNFRLDIANRNSSSTYDKYILETFKYTAKMSNNDKFAASYLQRLTGEVAEDLDKVRNADDFKPDSIPFLVHALQQGASQFRDADKERVIRSMETNGKPENATT